MPPWHGSWDETPLTAVDVEVELRPGLWYESSALTACGSHVGGAIVRRSARPTKVLAEGHERTMALDQSALLEVLEALKAADVEDRFR